MVGLSRHNDIWDFKLEGNLQTSTSPFTKWWGWTRQTEGPFQPDYFCDYVTSFQSCGLSTINKDYNGQPMLTLNDMKRIILSYQESSLLSQIIFQMTSSGFSICLLLFKQPAQNWSVRSFLGQWIPVSLVHWIWVSFNIFSLLPISWQFQHIYQWHLLHLVQTVALTTSWSKCPWSPW